MQPFDRKVGLSTIVRLRYTYAPFLIPKPAAVLAAIQLKSLDHSTEGSHATQNLKETTPQNDTEYGVCYNQL